MVRSACNAASFSNHRRPRILNPRHIIKRPGEGSGNPQPAYECGAPGRFGHRQLSGFPSSLARFAHAPSMAIPARSVEHPRLWFRQTPPVFRVDLGCASVPVVRFSVSDLRSAKARSRGGRRRSRRRSHKVVVSSTAGGPPASSQQECGGGPIENGSLEPCCLRVSAPRRCARSSRSASPLTHWIELALDQACDHVAT